MEIDAATAAPAEWWRWLPVGGWAFLTFNSASAIYSSKGEPSTVAFVVASYTNLLLLFWCLREFERSADRPVRRRRLRALLWLLASSLTVLFSYKAAVVMPVAMKAAVWFLAAASIVGGFFALVLHREKGSE